MTSPQEFSANEQCPSDDDLRRMLNGELVQASEALIESHVSDCTICEKRLERLSDSEQMRRWKKLLGDSDETGGASFHVRSIVTDSFAKKDFSKSDFRAEGFEILGVLGQGGMGVVFKARQKSLNRIVALKTLHSSSENEQSRVKRFLNEADSIASIQHPNVVTVFQTGAQETTPFIVLEYVDGPDLGQLISNAKTIDPIEATQLVQKLAMAAHAAHQKGIIHRDLKPSNVLLQEMNPEAESFSLRNYEPKITDFGLAKNFEHGNQTRTSILVGTPAYMSPEQITCAKDWIAPTVDVYALGVILFELLTGQLPFQSAKTYELFQLIENSEPPLVRKFRPQVSRDLEAVCLKCLEKKRENRYSTALELANDLERIIRREPVHARKITRLSRMRKWVVRNRMAVGLSTTLAVLLLSLAFFGIYVWNQRAEVLSDFSSSMKNAKQIYASAIQVKTNDTTRLESSRELVRHAINLKSTHRFLIYSNEAKELESELDLEIKSRHLFEQLDQVWLQTVVDYKRNKMFDAAAGTRYVNAFAEFGLSPEQPVEDAIVEWNLRSEKFKDTAISGLYWLLACDSIDDRNWYLELANSVSESSWLTDVLEAIEAEQDDVVQNLLESPDPMVAASSLMLVASRCAASEMPKQEIVSFLEKCCEKNPESFWLNSSMGRYIRFVGHPRKALPFLQDALVIRDTPEIRIQLAGIYNQLLRYQDEEDELVAAFEANPELTHLNFELAQCHELQKDFDRAIDYYRKAIEVEPERDQVRGRFLRCLKTAGRRREAREFASALIERTGETHEVYHSRAVALREMNRLEDSVDAYQVALELDPNCLFCYLELATVLESLNRYEEAIAELDAFLVKLPGSSTALTAKRKIYAKQKNWPAAIEVGKQLINLFPETVAFYHQLSIIYVDSGKPDLAAEMHRKVLTVDPSDVYSLWKLAKYHYGKGELSVAEVEYRKAIRANPGSERMRGELIDLLFEMHRFEEAAEIGREFIRSKPKSLYAHWKLLGPLDKTYAYQEAMDVFMAGKKLDSNPPKFFLPLLENKLVQQLESATKYSALTPEEVKTLNPEEKCLYANFVCVPNRRFTEASDIAAKVFEEFEFLENEGLEMKYMAFFHIAEISIQAVNQSETAEAREFYRLRCLKYLELMLEEIKTQKENDSSWLSTQQRLLQQIWTNPLMNIIRDQEPLANLPPEQSNRCRAIWASFETLLAESQS